MLLAPLLVRFALSFGAPEYFALMLLALGSLITGLAGRSAPKALFATLFGLALSMIGIDMQTGQARFTFGNLMLLGGIDAVTIAIGLFAVGEVFWAAATIRRVPRRDPKVAGLASDDKGRMATFVSSLGTRYRDRLYHWRFAGGRSNRCLLSLLYNAEQRFAKGRKELGQGAIEGVAGPEAANNAAAGGAMVPLLALGIPGSATTAVMLVAFQMYGLRPGPLLFAEQGDLVWGLIASLYLQCPALDPQSAAGADMGQTVGCAQTCALHRYPRL